MSVDLVRIVDSIHRDKNIPKDVLFEGIETALATAAKRHFPEAEEITVEIDRETGKTITRADGSPVDPPDFGRIAAQTAKQVIIQKIREAERDSLYDEFDGQRMDLVTGTVQRFDGGAVTVNLGKTDALLPRTEQIPGDDLHPGERVRAVIKDVRKAGQRVKIILSRTHPDFVRRLFELEIPEIADGVIQIRALAREAGYRSKVAVSSLDSKVDAVGACVGVRGTRIKNIVDELGGERIDIVRWNDSLQVLIPYALQPAEIEEVMLCHLLGRAIVLVREDQLSLAIGRRGQNVRLASKLVSWDIEIMTAAELDKVISDAVASLSKVEGVDVDLAERLVEQGILSYDDLSVMEIEDLVNTIDGLTPEQAEEIVGRAEVLAESETSELPRRKGARPAATVEAPADGSVEAGEAGVDGAEAEGGEVEGGEVEGEAAEAGGGFEDDSYEAEEQDEEDAARESGLDLPADSEPLRDLALAEEPYDASGHEVTSAPSDDDQGETERIVVEAVEGSDADGAEDAGDSAGSPEDSREA
jgi:N utilization substance protein A